MKRFLPPAAAVALAACVLLGPGAGSSAPLQSVATSQAMAIRISIPGQAGITEGYVSSPADSSTTIGGFSYPEDGSLVTSGSISLTAASASTSPTATASASAQINGLSILGGEVTIAAVAAKVTANAGSASGTGDFTGTVVSGIGGSAVAGSAIGTWGTISIGSGVGSPSTEADGAHGWHGSVGAVDIRLIADHNGLPAGTDIQIGYAAASVTAEPAAATTTTERTTTERTTTQRTTTEKQKQREKKKVEPTEPEEPPIGPVPTVRPHLTAGRYVFPVYGDAAYANTFGAARADVVWHHGDDIFAPLGAPVLAVADGTVFSVGWNKIGGWRLWLRDRAGNEFYYAHLSAYSPYALNNAQVRAGTVLGFVGSTGDAEGTPYHLHFEIHPVQLLGLGCDGVVDPTSYLDAWRRLQDVRFSSAGAFLPGLVRLTSTRAPEPGAILLQISDISSASGLDPGSLRRALAALTTNAAPADEANLSASARSGDLGRG